MFTCLVNVTAAQGADVNSVCCFLVGREAGALREALPAQRALVGLLPAVDHRVSDQVALLGEAAAALHAAEWLLARVTPQMLLKLAEPREAFVAVRAAEPLLAEAGSPRRPHPPREAEAAAVAKILARAPHVNRGVSVLVLCLLRNQAWVYGINQG